MAEETFGYYLKRRFQEWAGKQLGRSGRIPSQAEFAVWLDVPTTSLSTWMNDVRTPVGENADRLADKLGVEVYDRLNLPRRMPRNKKLMFLATIWDKLEEHEQDELYERAKNLSRQNSEEVPGNIA